MYCTVLTDSKSPGIASGLTYESGDKRVQIGSHVRVPLRQKIVEGIVIDVTKEKAQEVSDVKEIKELLGDKPLLSEAQIKLARWMSDYYCCSLRQALSAFLPAPPWSRLLPEEKAFYRLTKPNPKVRGSKQQAIIDYLQNKECVAKEMLRQETGASTSTIMSLLEKRILTEETRSEEEAAFPASSFQIHRPSLTSDQQSVYLSIKQDDRPALLFGVTSSGKTEVYAQLIADTIEAGKQAILLVPEILLTEHSIRRFEELIDRDYIAVIHSRLTQAQRRTAWKRVRQGAARLIIGSRSALFAPAKELGLVILDEEHEWTYKNEQTPRYHARETAETLCRFTGSKLILGTATPSLEAWSRAKNDTYHLTRLPNRYENRPMPQVRIVDLGTVQFGSLYPFSPPLLAAIEERLQRGEQSVLFLNRRGIASALLCLECRRRVVSPESQLPFTVHHSGQGKPYLLDHTSNLKCDLPKECPACGSANLRAVGAGTQKIEHILTKRFPNARLLRADSDTLTHPEHMRLLLKKMHEGQADILLGTQSVVKGLDLPGVTLAAVLLADIGLSLPHFRAGERIFQLLTQLTGRSGRAKPGDVIIQTFRPDAPEVLFAAKHETEKYMEQELKLRLHAGYPPATQMIRLLIRGENPAEHAKKLSQEIQKVNPDLKMGCAPTIFGGGRVWHILLRGDSPKDILTHLDLGGVTVDVDPVECV